MQSSVFYFSIPEISCSSCTAAIKKHLNGIKGIQSVDIDAVTKRCKVVVQENVFATHVLQEIKQCGKTFPNTKILTDKKTKYFEIEGLSDPAQIEQLGRVFDELKLMISEYQINYASKSLKLELIDDEQGDDIIPLVLEKFKQDRLLNKVKLSALSLNNDRIVHQEKYQRYFKRSLLNLIITAPLWLMSLLGLIPSPLTLMGQMVGLGIGTAMMGVMYLTGREFYRDAWNELVKNRAYSMNTLVALGTGSAWIYSMLLVAFPTFFPVAILHYQFLAVSMILGIINVGRGIREYLQQKTRAKVKSIEEMFIELQPQRATRLSLEYSKDLNIEMIQTATKEDISYRDICTHDLIEVKAGERIPVEGVIAFIDGNQLTRVDQSTLTGESKLLEKKVQESVFSGSLNCGSTIYIRAKCAGADGNLTKLIQSTQQRANAGDASISSAIDKVAKIFVPTIIGVSILSGLGWFIFGPAPQLAYMIKAFLSVMLCACPCALGLATPISTTISTYKFFKEGILVHQTNSIEKIAAVDTVVFDKTGTLTEPQICDVHSEEASWLNNEKLVRYVSSLEQAHAHHPIAQAFDNKLQENLDLVRSEKMENGLDGVLAVDKEHHVRVVVGNRFQLEGFQIHLSDEYKNKAAQWEKKGYTTLYVAASQAYSSLGENHVGPKQSCQCVGMIALKHHIRADAKETVQTLKNMGIDLHILSGDNEAATQRVAKKLGIEKVFGQKTSKEKEEHIHALRTGQGKPKVVAMIGDGVNDIEAIEKADAGIAIGPWTAASTRADIAIHSLSNLVPLLAISKQTMRNIHQNLWWMGIFNVMSLVSASGLLYPFFGFMLSPILASVAMAGSSISVVLNSTRLTYLIDRCITKIKGEPNQSCGLKGIWHSLLNPCETAKNFKQEITLETSFVSNKPFSPGFDSRDQLPIAQDENLISGVYKKRSKVYSF